MKKFIFLIALLLFSRQLIAQDSSNTRQETREEVWPKIELYYRINNKLRIYALYSATKLRNSSFTDGGFGVYMDYFVYPHARKRTEAGLKDSTRSYFLWFRGGYMYSSTPPESKDPFKLHTFVTEANATFRLPYDIMLINKNRFDWRVINGNLEPRYRPRLTFEKDMHTKFLYFKPIIYGEYYIYFNRGGLNRFRVSAGIQTKFTSHIEFETYYVHQFANGKGVNALNAVGLALKLYFKYKKN